MQQRQRFASSALLFTVLLLFFGSVQQVCAAYYWQDNRAVTPGQWPSAADACRLGEAQRYMDEHNLSPALYRINPAVANVYLDNESQCNYVIEKKVFGLWVTFALDQVINVRVGEADLCFNGLTLDSDGRCAPKNDGPPSCPSNGTNPINGATANKYQMEPDYVGDGPFPLRFQRHYNSVVRTPDALASNWRNNYERSLSVSADDLTVKVFRHDGRSYDVAMSGAIGTPPADITDQLAAQSDGTWKLTTAANEVETYDSRGRLISIANLAGIKQILAYDNLNRLSTVTDPFARTLTFGYDASNRIATVTDPSGAVYNYGYDASNNLATVTYPDGDANAANNPIRTYVYNESANTSGANLPHALTGIVDENSNRFATFKYDASGRGISSEHAGGAEKTTLVFNANGTTTVTDSAGTAGTGTARTYGYQNLQGVLKATSVSGGACNACGGSTSAFSYDTNGNVASTTDFNGNLTCYTYDLARNLENVRLEGIAPGGACPANLLTYTPIANSTERKVTTTWHTTYRLPTQIDEPGRRTAYVYFANGTLQTKTVTDTLLGNSRAWNYTYDANGQLKTVDGPRLATDVLDTTTFDYYTTASANNAIGDLWKITNALNQVTTFTQYDKHGRALSLTDPNGLVTTLSYDALGRLKRRTTGVNTTSIDYNANGLLKKITLPDLSNYNYAYDAAQRLSSITDNLGNKVEFTLDKLGNSTQQITKNPDNSVAKSQTAVYDALNRLQQTLGAQGQTTKFTYDAKGNLKTSIDPKNQPATVFTYDALDRLKQVQDAAAGITQYTYNALDQLTQVTAPNGAQTSYTLDALGNRLTETSPDSGSLQATYDAAGNRKSRTDARGITANYTYDALNRLLTVTYPSTGENVTYTYDTGIGCTNGTGRLCKAQDGAGSTTFAYDTQGNLTQQVRIEAGQNYTTSYGYDSVNRISQVTTPGNRTITYHRDALGRIDTVTTPINGTSTGITSQITYNALSLVTGQTLANGYNESHGFNADGQTISLSQVNPTSGGTTPKQIPIPAWALVIFAIGLALISGRYGRQHGKHLAVLLVFGIGLALSGLLYSAAAYAPITLHYDANGNIDERVDGSGMATFTYDPLDRLKTETGPIRTQTLGYDSNGNRTGDGGGSYTYLPNSNLLQTAHGLSISKDTAGNTTGDGSYTYIYNQAGQLSQVKQGVAIVVNYFYDYQGRRSRKLVGSTTTVYHYDLDNHLVAETNNLGTLLRTYIWRDDAPVLQIEASGGQDKPYYLEVDTLNTPRTARNDTGAIVWQWYADAYGTNAPLEDPDGDGTTTRINLRFPGQYYDQETGLHYNMARYYNPSSGRYLQPDPIGLAGGINTYAYVGGNPVNAVDPDGLTAVLPWVEPIFQIRPLPMSPLMPIDPVLPIPDIPGIPNNNKKDPFGEQCRSLARRISNTRDEIFNKRYPDLDKDPNPLPWRIGPGEDLRDTIRGHEKLLNRRLNELRKLEDEYAEKCVPLACLAQ